MHLPRGRLGATKAPSRLTGSTGPSRDAGPIPARKHRGGVTPRGHVRTQLRQPPLVADLCAYRSGATVLEVSPVEWLEIGFCREAGRAQSDRVRLQGRNRVQRCRTPARGWHGTEYPTLRRRGHRSRGIRSNRLEAPHQLCPRNSAGGCSAPAAESQLTGSSAADGPRKRILRASR